MIFHVIKTLSLTNVHVDCWPVVMLTDWSWHLASYSRLQHPQPNVKLDLQLMEGAWSWDVMSELSHSRRSRMGWGVIALIERNTSTLEQWRWGQHGPGPSTSTVSLLLLTQVMSACRHVKKKQVQCTLRIDVESSTWLQNLWVLPSQCQEETTCV